MHWLVVIVKMNGNRLLVDKPELDEKKAMAAFTCFEDDLLTGKVTFADDIMSKESKLRELASQHL